MQSINKIILYLIHSGENIFHNKLGYQLKYYTPMKHTIDQCGFTDLISYAFYINKLNLVGIVYEGKVKLFFLMEVALKIRGLSLISKKRKKKLIN